MVTVRFFGMLRMDLGQSSLTADAASVRELVDRVAPRIGLKDGRRLANAVIFVNGENIARRRGLRTPLSDGDEVQFFSPATGG